MRLRPEELVTYACRGSRRAGDGHTSCARPFPGCPGLSQSRPRRVFHAAVLSTVLSRNADNVRRAAAEVHGFLPPICSPRAPVNNFRGADCSQDVHMRPRGWPGRCNDGKMRAAQVERGRAVCSAGRVVSWRRFSRALRSLVALVRPRVSAWVASCTASSRVGAPAASLNVSAAR